MMPRLFLSILKLFFAFRGSVSLKKEFFPIEKRLPCVPLNPFGRNACRVSSSAVVVAPRPGNSVEFKTNLPHQKTKPASPIARSTVLGASGQRMNK